MARIMFPGYRSRLVESTVRKPHPYFRSCEAPIALKNESASIVAVFCGRVKYRWLIEPNDCAVVKLRPACKFKPPIGSRMNPVL